MAKKTILIVDDEEDVLELVKINLEKNGYIVKTAISGEEACRKTGSLIPDLVLLDLMLPGIDGLQVCRNIKTNSTTRHIPIIMLTARGEEADIVTGLELGAEDYVTKPFSPKVLVARVRRVLNRSISSDSLADTLKIHNIIVSPSRREVLIDGQPVDLTYTEFSILHTLMARPGQVFTRYQIVDAIRGHDYVVTDRAVDVQIVSLRKKMGSSGKYIETVRGVGYRFRD